MDDADLSDLLVAVQRLTQQLDRISGEIEAISSKLDKTNELLADLNRSQWS